MRSNYQIIKRVALGTTMISLLLFASCKIDPVADPNNPGVVPISQNPTPGDIQSVVTGTESAMRDQQGFYWDDVGVIGREFYRISKSDPRLSADLLGKGSAELDNNTFYITNPYAGRYRAIKNANILIEGLTNTTSAAISPLDKTLGIAYAKTIKAHELLMVYNLVYSNGIRVDVSNPDALGPFLSPAASLDAIISLLNEAYADLSANPTETFLFHSSIFGDEAGVFAQFNRALAARCAVYKQDWAGALTALTNSFFNLAGDLDAGAYYKYSTAGGDQLNPMYLPRNGNSEVRIAEPHFITEAESTSDTRLSKVALRNASFQFDDLTGTYDVFLYTSNIDPIAIIRNEELILIYAEANIQLGGVGNLADAVTALNVVRTAAGLPIYAGLVTQAALLTEMLNQRRYSLYGEGHRWVDMRRYNLLGTLPLARAGDDVWPEFPHPAEENF